MDSPNQYPCHAESEMIQAPLGSLALSHSIAPLSSRSETSRSIQSPTRRRSSSLEREWNFPTPSSLKRALCMGSMSPLRIEPRYRHFEIQSPTSLLKPLEHSLTAPTLPCCRSAQLIPLPPLIAEGDELPLSGPTEIPAISHLPVSGLQPDYHASPSKMLA